MIGLGISNMILVLIKSIAGPGEVEPEDDPSIEDIAMVSKLYNLGKGIPSFMVLNRPTH